MQSVEQSERNREPRIEPAAQLSIAEIASFLWLYRISIATVCAVPLVLAILYVLLTPSLYTARVQLLLEPGTPVPVNDHAAAAERQLDSQEIDSQIAVLRSENMTSAVIRELNLGEKPEFAGKFAVQPGGSNEDPGTLLVRSRLFIAIFDQSLDVRRNGLSYAIDVNFTSRDPDLAARIANALARTYIEGQLATRAEAIRAGSRWLEARIEEIRRQMNEATLRMQRFKVRRDYRIGGQSPVPQNGADGPPAASPGNEEQETLEELESRAQAYRRIFESYLQAYAESLQRQSFPIANARVITPATRPLVPGWPKTSLIIALALLVGLLVGFAQALFRYQLSPRLERE